MDQRTPVEVDQEQMLVLLMHGRERCERAESTRQDLVVRATEIGLSRRQVADASGLRPARSKPSSLDTGLLGKRERPSPPVESAAPEARPAALRFRRSLYIVISSRASTLG
jgi:hypothetical protein